MAERALVTRPKGEVPQMLEPEQELRSISAQKKYFYKVGMEEGKEKKAPSAAMVFAKADEHGKLFYEILDAGKDGEKAWAHVRAWEGPQDTPQRRIERYVCLRFADDLMEAIYRLLAKGGVKLFQGDYWPNRQPKKTWYRIREEDWKIDEDGWPLVVNPYVKLELMQEHQRFRRFAERTAQTQAIRAALLQLLDSTWDEESEMRAEKSEDAEPEDTDSSSVTEMPPATEAQGATTIMDTRATPRTLGELKNALWTLVLKVCDGELPKAYAWLKDNGQMGGKPPIAKISDIPDLDMVQEIFARAEAAWQVKTKG